ncbi:MAG: ATP-dependent Clp protease adaptor ClpS [Planctomycetes bacterium]|nr:ATP-dependent Clp protease adaptor ClpS [Planctomycetota bacterium]
MASLVPRSAGPGPAAPDVRTAPRTDERTDLAPLYRVLIHNDDVTPMDLVVQVLTQFFRKAQAEAVEIMLTAHLSGVALVAVLPLEEAEFRVDQAHSYARARNYPLTFTYEPAT